MAIFTPPHHPSPYSWSSLTPLIQISFSPQPFAVIEIKDNCTILFYQPLFLGWYWRDFLSQFGCFSPPNPGFAVFVVHHEQDFCCVTHKMLSFAYFQILLHCHYVTRLGNQIARISFQLIIIFHLPFFEQEHAARRICCRDLWCVKSTCVFVHRNTFNSWWIEVRIIVTW